MMLNAINVNFCVLSYYLNLSCCIFTSSSNFFSILKVESIKGCGLNKVQKVGYVSDSVTYHRQEFGAVG